MKLSAILLIMSFILVGCDSPTTATRVTSLGCEWQLGSEFVVSKAEAAGEKRFVNSGLDNPLSVEFGVSQQLENTKIATIVDRETIADFEIMTYEVRPVSKKQSLTMVQIKRGDNSILLSSYESLYARTMIKNCIEQGSTPLLTYPSEV